MNPIALFFAALHFYLSVPPTPADSAWTCHPPGNPETSFTIAVTGGAASVTLASDGRQGAGYTVSQTTDQITLTREYKHQKILVMIDQPSGRTVVLNPVQTSHFQCDRQ